MEKPDLSNQKLDTGKPPAFRGLVAYFPRALLAVAGVSAFGHAKYGEWGGWSKVDNAPQRYADALLRHALQRATGEVFNPSDANLRHAAQAAWNALAVLELELRQAEHECGSTAESVWIPWHGGNCPVEDSTEVLVKLRDGTISSKPLAAQGYRWDHRSSTSDIVAYSIARQAELERAT